MRSNVWRAKRCPTIAAFVFRAGALSSRVNRPQRQGTGLLTERIERGIWQWRFRGHAILDDADDAAHGDDVHFNPAKHGYFTAPGEWPYATVRACVARGRYLEAWVGADFGDLEAGEPV